jgi:hypothetical protein
MKQHTSGDSASSDAAGTETKHKRTTPVIHHHTKKHHEKKHHKRSGHSANGTKVNASAVYDVCEDLDPTWRDADGLTCQMYTDAWCTGEGFKPYSTNMGGAAYNYPEKQCCSCGGGKAKAGQTYEAPYLTADADDDEDSENVQSDGSSDGSCMDTPSWKNQYDVDCAGYVEKGYCQKNGKGGYYVKTGTGGAAYGYPESNCCGCGGGKPANH